MRLERLGGVAAIALLATMASASAVPVIIPNTMSPLLNLGTGGGPGYLNPGAVNIAPGRLTGTGIAAIDFLGGANGPNLSGEYVGTVGNVATTPFPPLDGLTGTPATQHYLAAQPGDATSGVRVTYTTPQTSIELLWGTIDTAANSVNDNRNLFITTLSPTPETINGSQILAMCGGTPGVANCEVTISSLATGTTGFIARDLSPNASAFEFVPGTAVPEPASLAILGAALAGLGLLRRRKTA